MKASKTGWGIQNKKTGSLLPRFYSDRLEAEVFLDCDSLVKTTYRVVRVEMHTTNRPASLVGRRISGDTVRL